MTLGRLVLICDGEAVVETKPDEKRTACRFCSPWLDARLGTDRFDCLPLGPARPM